MTQWEYESHTLNLGQEPGNRPDHALNRLGLEGWELVGFVPPPVMGMHFVCVLKRPKAEEGAWGFAITGMKG